MSSIKAALKKQFSKYQIVFWYDIKKELRDEFEALDLPGREKIEVKNNQFGLKYRILREEPNTKFLLYFEGSPPDHPENWLLDLQLSMGEFRADQVSLWLTELNLGPEYWEVSNDHKEFFLAKNRRDALGGFLTGEESNAEFRLKLLAVCAGVKFEVRVDSVIENLLAEEAKGEEEKIKLINRCGLAEFFWGELNNHFGYQAPEILNHNFIKLYPRWLRPYGRLYAY